MRVPLSWLREHVEVPVEPARLAEDLTLAGLAVDAIEQHGDDVVRGIEEILACDRVADDIPDRPMSILEGSATLPDALRAILKLMESNIEEPLSIEDLAHYAQVSRRQIDRLFHRHMKTTPSRYYLELRITRARRLLLQTNAPLTTVAIACGFTGAPHFSRSYRDFFGVSPSQARSTQRL